MFKLSNILKTTLTSTNVQTAAILRFSVISSEIKQKQQSATAEAANETADSEIVRPKNNYKYSTGIVAQVFASLGSTEIETPKTDDGLRKAETVNDLLAVSQGRGISRRHALKVVSILSEWTSKGKVSLHEFEGDPRFLKICRILGNGKLPNVSGKIKVASRSEDLSTVLGVTADDEAAKLVGTLSLPQMVKVMSTLSQKKRRSTLLLRSLAFNIAGSSQKLDLKQSADVLYSMAVLSFYDPNLMEKVCNDVCNDINSNSKKSAAVGSILTSLGILRYKHLATLDALGEWILKNQSLCRPQDTFALFQTYAVLNHQSPLSDELSSLLPQLTQSEAGNPAEWLDFVWSLVLLNLAGKEHVESVLRQEFSKHFKGGKSVSGQLKLLNIDGFAEFMDGYDGERISEDFKSVCAQRSKEKDELVETVVSTLKNLMPAKNYLQTDVNTQMGFYIDVYCALDKKCNPVPLDKANTTDVNRLAIMACDYHDYCRGRVELTGMNRLAVTLLEKKGYKVVVIPYMDFRPKDKLIRRVQYLESKLKSVIQVK